MIRAPAATTRHGWFLSCRAIAMKASRSRFAPFAGADTRMIASMLEGDVR